MKLINAEYSVSLFDNLICTTPADQIDINQVITIIKDGHLKNEIELLRSIDRGKQYNSIKQTKLPCISTSGVFKKRNNSSLIEHSGLIQIDFDEIEDYDSAFGELIKDGYTYLCFRSPGGKGIKLIVKINPSEETHLKQFYALEEYYKNEYDLELDKACKAISRCLLLSYDPHVYCNPFADTFEFLLEKPIEDETKINSQLTNYIHNSSLQKDEIVEQIIQAVESSHTDITYTYNNWMKVGFSLVNDIGEGGRNYFHRLSRFHKEYNTGECDKQYDKCLNSNGSGISLGTLIYLVKENSIEFTLQKDEPKETIQSSSSTTKKASTDDLLKKLKAIRLKLAKENKMPAYTIFTDAALIEMVLHLPTTQEGFIEVKGVGLKTAEKYAQYFLPILKGYNGVEGGVKLSFDGGFEKKKSILDKLKPTEKELHEKLRSLRTRISNEEKIKPFWIFGNATLTEIVKLKPKTKNELLGIKGIGQKKVDWFGDELIEILENYR